MPLPADVRYDELDELVQGILPAEIIRVGRDHARHAFPLDVDLGAHGNSLQDHGDAQLTGQVRILETLKIRRGRPANAISRNGESAQTASAQRTFA